MEIDLTTLAKNIQALFLNIKWQVKEPNDIQNIHINKNTLKVE